MRASETCSRWFLWVATIAALLSSTACRSAAPTSTLGGAADNPDFGMVGGASGVRRQEPVVESVSGAESLATDEDLAAAGDDAAYALHGYLNVGLRGRTGGGDSDADLFTFLSLDGGDAERNAATFHVSARASKDLGGGQDSDDVFFDVSDTYDSGFDARLYSAHVDVHSIEEFSILRIGRQQDIETPVPAYYDGVHVRSEEMAEGKMHFGGYGGLSTHLYESTDSDDRVFGAYLGGRPWRDGRWRFDWMRAKDHRRTDGDESDLLSVNVWQTLANNVNLEGFFSRLESDNRDLRLAASWLDPELDLQLRGVYYQLLEEQKTSALETDPFTTSLQDFQPYHLVSLSASKGFGSRYRLAGGLDVRRLDDDDDSGPYNRDFERGFLTATVADLLHETSALSVTGDYWDGDGKDYGTLGVDLSSELSDKWDGAIGTFYSMYKVDTRGTDEKEDVRTYFVRAGYEISEDLSLDIHYDFENTDDDDFHVVRMDVKWRF